MASRLLVNCPVCDNVCNPKRIKPRPLRLNLRTHETKGIPGIKGIQNVVYDVDDRATRRLVLEQLRAVVEHALSELDEALL